MRNLRLSLAVLTWLACAAVIGTPYAAEEAEPQAIAIEGNVVTPQSWTDARLKSELAKEIKTIDYKLHDAAHTATAVPLIALVKASGLKFDPQIKGQDLRSIVVVEGRDGYMASFALAEIMPEVGNREVWVALERDGKPLDERDRPAMIVAPADQKAGRWVHGINAIRVSDPAK